MGAAPVVYILHGDNEVGIKEFIEAMRLKMGDAPTAEMNMSRFAGRVDLGEMRRAAFAVPFLALRRLVVLEGVAETLRTNQDQEQFLAILGSAPQSTAVVIVEHAAVKQNHWLLKWAAGNLERAHVKSMIQPKGGMLVKWIQDQAKEIGGEIRPQAAQHLVSLIGEDNRQAMVEVEKLLAYVNYTRPVEVDDVELLTAPVLQGDVFKMVDALGARNGRVALTLLHELLADRDAIMLFGMIIRQFRLLLMYKDLSGQNLSPAAAAKELGLHEFVFSKIAAQARNFEMPQLEAIYRHLADIDTRIKTGQIEIDIALDTFVASVTSR